MIYLVTTEMSLFDNEAYKTITVKESLDLMKDWKIIQLDSETSGRNAHLCDFLCVQLGNDKADARVVIDTATIDIKLYKDLIEKAFIVGHNLKFDLQFLYNYHIIPRRIYDTMIVENLLYLGYPHISMSAEEYDKWEYTFPYHSSVDAYGNETRSLSYALDAVAEKRLGIHLDKSVRGEIIWRGLDTKVINYSALDVTYLEKIMHSQVEDLKKQGLMEAAKLECNFVPAIAYLEWSGIYLNPEKWKQKMNNDKQNLQDSLQKLNSYALSNPKLKQWCKVDLQGDLFTGFNTEPQWTVDWQKAEALKVIQALGFDTTVKDKKSGEEKDSIMEKVLKPQKGIDDTFLQLYFDYQGYFKVITSFGQGHLNAINPITGRIHTVYKQLGAASGRMSCGSSQPDTDLAKYKKLLEKDCTFPNIQQLPSDDATRGAFTNQQEDTLICSADFSALESRLGADIYQEKAMLDEFLHGSGDMHSLCAKMVFKEELKDIAVKDIKDKRPDLRKKVKNVEFAKQFGGSASAISASLGCSMEEAQKFSDFYDEGFKGVTDFKNKSSKFVRQNGYILMCKYSGHKMYWYDHKKWLKRQESFTQDFWEEYRNIHKPSHDQIAQKVSMHFKAAAKWDRMALNAPTQGSGIVILKLGITEFFNWIVDNGYFDVVKLCALVHDEAVIEFPKTLPEAPQKLKECMEYGASLVCKSLPIPSCPETGTHWIH